MENDTIQSIQHELAVSAQQIERSISALCGDRTTACFQRYGNAGTVGMILCKSKNKVVAEYALRDLRKPVGVSEYRVTSELPKQLRNGLPTIEELELHLKEETST